MGKPTGKLAQKLQAMQQDMDNIIKHIELHGPTRREELIRIYKIDIRKISHRLKKLQDNGLIKTLCKGSSGSFWTLGKQEKFRKPPKPRAKAKVMHEQTDKFKALPKLVQNWFGYVEDFNPPTGRIVKETMPDIPIRTHRNTIGSGTCAHIERLANL